MIELFSCRNCVHNGGQSLNAGRGKGFCLQHDSVIADPGDTTCKYLHRKDLPRFVVEGATAEHAAEFVRFPSMASLATKKPIEPIRYSERYVWERRLFNPVTHALALYHRGSGPAWHAVQMFTGGLDGIRSLAHVSLIRRHMERCGTWRSSYRLVLGLLVELPSEPHFRADDLIYDGEEDDPEEVRMSAAMDVLFGRLSGLQEYGWHAGIEDLIWITDSLGEVLLEPRWSSLHSHLVALRETWTEGLINHATEHDEFFPAAGPSESEGMPR